MATPTSPVQTNWEGLGASTGIHGRMETLADVWKDIQLDVTATEV